MEIWAKKSKLLRIQTAALTRVDPVAGLGIPLGAVVQDVVGNRIGRRFARHAWELADRIRWVNAGTASVPWRTSRARTAAARISAVKPGSVLACLPAQERGEPVGPIYPFSDDEVDQLMNHSGECVLMWATKDGWPVGVTHTFLWHDGKIWLTFAAHRHRAEAIRRDSRVSVNVSSAGYSPLAPKGLPRGAITFKGRGEFFDDNETKTWFYPALSKKLSPSDEGAATFFTLPPPAPRHQLRDGLRGGHGAVPVPRDHSTRGVR